MEIISMPCDGDIEVLNYKEGLDFINSLDIKDGIVKSHGYDYLPLIMTFDIEFDTLNNVMFEEGMPEEFRQFSFPYCWQSKITGANIDKTIFGGDVEEFFYMIDNSNICSKIICFIHNLTCEANVLLEEFVSRKAEIFWKNKTQPLFIRLGNFEFRDSAQLTHKSLATLGKEIGYEKLKGDFDYTIKRDFDYKFSPMEQNYRYRDCAILNKYLEQLIRTYTNGKSINPAKLPFTQTGFVKKDIKAAWSYTNFGRNVLKETALIEEDYDIIKEAFLGGLCIANEMYINEEISDIAHFDLTSAYIYALASGKYPYRLNRVPASNIEEEFFASTLYSEDEAVIATIAFKGMELKNGKVPFAPVNDRIYAEELADQGGRVVLADLYIGTFCDLDIINIFESYDVEEIQILDFWYGVKKPLPRNIIKVLINYFIKKSQLKGVEGKEAELALVKEMLNAIFGLMGMRLKKNSIDMEDLFTVDGESVYTNADTMPYQWAIQCTAICRDILYSTISEFPKEDFLYCDTDSIIAKDTDAVRQAVERHNERVMARLEELKKDYPNIIPENIKGEPQYLGLFTDEKEKDNCVGFKTIGSKRYYMKHPDGTVDLTVSGLNNTKTVKNYLTGNVYNGYNTYRLIKMFGSIEKAFDAVYDEEDVVLDIVTDEDLKEYNELYGAELKAVNVNNLMSYNTRADFMGVLNGRIVMRKTSFILKEVKTSLNMNDGLLAFLKSIKEGRELEESSKPIIYQ